MKIKRMFAAVKKDTTLELLCYDQIGKNWDGSGITAQNMSAQIKAAGSFDSISLRVNSPGGDAFEGIAILNLLRAQGKIINVFVDGLAASAASILAMAGDTVTVGEGAMMMIHNAWSMAIGDAVEMRKTADTLERVSDSIAQTYVGKTGKTLAEIKTLMDAETWMSAEDCVKEGFANAVAPLDVEGDKNARALRASFDLSVFAKAPASLKSDESDELCACPCEPCQQGACDTCTHEGCECANCDCKGQNAAATKAIIASNLNLFEARLRLLHA